MSKVYTIRLHDEIEKKNVDNKIFWKANNTDKKKFTFKQCTQKMLPYKQHLKSRIVNRRNKYIFRRY